MEIEDLQERIEDVIGDERDEKDHDRMLVMMVDSIIEAEMLLPEAEDGPDGSAQRRQNKEHRKGALAGVLVTAFDYAAKHDIDVGEAMAERCDQIESMAEMMEEGEAPSDTDTPDGRGFY
jgi:hypothetical protein